MASGFRFDPPPMELGAELAWILARAFGPVEAANAEQPALDPDRVIGLATALDLAARIGARTPPPMLLAALGEVGAETIVDAHRQAAARALVIERLAQEIAGAAREVDAKLVFLKGAALMLAGQLSPGSRAMSDLDVLARGRDAPRLQQQLKEVGWTELPGPSGEHQLQMLTHRSGIGLEVHIMVLGVRTAGSDSASLDDLIEIHLCDPLPDPLTGCWRPQDAVLLAHALVHGIAQHGLKPLSYSMTRLVADAQDLCRERGRWDELLPEAMRWIESDVSVDEAEAVRDLTLRLAGGDAPNAIAAAGDPASRLLCHILAGVLDDRYREGLRLRSLANPLAARSRSRTLLRSGFQTVWLTRAQVEMLYGTPRTSLGYWGWRLWRPFDLAQRSARYGWAWLADRWRR